MKKGEGVYNVIVIGAGTAGLVTAAGTAGLGGRVALIERNLMGGDCLNLGCVPSKALISSARLIQQIRESEKRGLNRQEPQFAFEKVFERMRARRAKIAPNDAQERFESLGVDVFTAKRDSFRHTKLKLALRPHLNPLPQGEAGQPRKISVERCARRILSLRLAATRRFQNSKGLRACLISRTKRSSMS